MSDLRHPVQTNLYIVVTITEYMIVVCVCVCVCVCARATDLFNHHQVIFEKKGADSSGQGSL